MIQKKNNFFKKKNPGFKKKYNSIFWKWKFLSKQDKINRIKLYIKNKHLPKQKWRLIFLRFLFKIKKKPQFSFLNYFFLVFITKKRKNIFVNLSDLKGQVLYKMSSGFFFKKSLRKTFFATLHVMQKINIYRVFKKKKPPKRFNVFLNIQGSLKTKGFKKNLKTFLETTNIKFKSFNYINKQAHNGVRKKKPRRK